MAIKNRSANLVCTECESDMFYLLIYNGSLRAGCENCDKTAVKIKEGKCFVNLNEQSTINIFPG
jgi:Zn finger protein HypA/HybF involved in hydrogenase expression